MSLPTIDDLTSELLAIEQQLDGSTYRPGPWSRFLRRVHLLEPEQRRPLVEIINRVNDKLHLRNHDVRRFSVRTGVLMELGVMLASIAGVRYGVHLDSGLLVGVSALALCQACQPLLKMLAGTLLGVRYSHFWLWLGLEPRTKMRYGTYVVLTLGQRIFLHFMGTLGSAGAFLAVGYAVSDAMPGTSLVCLGIGWFMMALNASFFVLGWFGKLRNTFSGAAAAAEILKHRKIREARAALAAAPSGDQPAAPPAR